MARTPPALELKGRMLSTTRMRVLNADLTAIERQLAELAKQMPQAVRGMAVVIESEELLDLDALLVHLRALGIRPLGVIDGVLNENASRAGLAVLAKDNSKSPRSEPEPAATTALAPRKAARIITEPVRSGQQIYADGGDLVVLGTVSPGAEVIADGCVHVYGPMRGRAIAGARGDESARVFCRKFEAELVAVAGIYSVAEQMQGAPKGQMAQVLLNQGRLVIEPLAQ